MAHITLFRHAKAEIPNLQTADFERMLASRGRHNAVRMGRFIKEKGLLPDLVMYLAPFTLMHLQGVSCVLLRSLILPHVVLAFFIIGLYI